MNREMYDKMVSNKSKDETKMRLEYVKKRLEELKRMVNIHYAHHSIQSLQHISDVFKLWVKYQNLLKDTWILAGIVIDPSHLTYQYTLSIKKLLLEGQVNPQFLDDQKRSLGVMEYGLAKICMEFDLFGQIHGYWDIRIEPSYFGSMKMSFDEFLGDLVETHQLSKNSTRQGPGIPNQIYCWQADDPELIIGCKTAVKETVPVQSSKMVLFSKLPTRIPLLHLNDSKKKPLPVIYGLIPTDPEKRLQAGNTIELVEIEAFLYLRYFRETSFQKYKTHSKNVDSKFSKQILSYLKTLEQDLDKYQFFNLDYDLFHESNHDCPLYNSQLKSEDYRVNIQAPNPYTTQLSRTYKSESLKDYSYDPPTCRWTNPYLQLSKLSHEIPLSTSTRSNLDLTQIQDYIWEEANIKFISNFIQNLVKDQGIVFSEQQMRYLTINQDAMAIGRSGTGKTTLAAFKALAINLLFKAATKRYLYESTQEQRHQLRMRQKEKKFYQSIGVKPRDRCKAKYPKFHKALARYEKQFRQRLTMQLKTMTLSSDDMESFTGLRTVFVTASPVLTNEVKKFYEELMVKVKKQLHTREEARAKKHLEKVKDEEVKADAGFEKVDAEAKQGSDSDYDGPDFSDFSDLEDDLNPDEEKSTQAMSEDQKHQLLDNLETAIELQKQDLMDELELESQLQLPHKMNQMKASQYPCFLTVKKLVYMLDACSSNSFFSRLGSGEIQGMARSTEWHSESQTGTFIINQYYKEGKGYDQQIKNLTDQILSTSDMTPEERSEYLRNEGIDEIEYNQLLEQRKEQASLGKKDHPDDPDEPVEDDFFSESSDEDEKYIEIEQELQSQLAHQQPYSKMAAQKEMKVQEQLFMQEIDFEQFQKNFFPKYRGSLKLSALTVWTEIFSVLEGSKQCNTQSMSSRVSKKFLSLKKYLKLTSTYRHYSTFEKRQIYRLFGQYLNWKQQNRYFDFMDVVSHVIQHLNPQMRRHLDYLVVDEVQDLTPLTLQLLLIITDNKVFFSGDSAQTIAKGVGFRFYDLGSLFTIKDQKSQPAVVQLTKNYRSHQKILDIANSVVDLIELFFPKTIDHLAREKSESSGPKPVVIQGVDDDNLAGFLMGEQGTKNPQFGCGQVVIVRNQETKKRLPPFLQGALTLTIYEAKGLEFDDVILYDFFQDIQNSGEQNKWRLIKELEYIKTSQEFQTANSDDHDNDIALSQLQKNDNDMNSIYGLKINSVRTREEIYSDFSILCVELKHLYVALTRPKVRLIIYESKPSPPQDTIFKYWAQRGVVTWISNQDQLDQAASEVGFSNMDDFDDEKYQEEWRVMGIKLFQKKNYESAVKCFEKSKSDELRVRTLAYMYAGQGSELLSDANAKFYQVKFNRALKKHEKTKFKRQAKNAKKDAFKRFANAGAHFEQIKLHRQAAQCYYTSLDFESAATNFQAAGLYQQSAECFERIGNFINAADMYAQNGLPMKALQCYEKQEDWEGLLNCLTKFKDQFKQAERESLINQFVPLALNSFYMMINEKGEEGMSQRKVLALDKTQSEMETIEEEQDVMDTSSEGEGEGEGEDSESDHHPEPEPEVEDGEVSEEEVIGTTKEPKPRPVVKQPSMSKGQSSSSFSVISKREYMPNMDDIDHLSSYDPEDEFLKSDASFMIIKSVISLDTKTMSEYSDFSVLSNSRYAKLKGEKSIREIETERDLYVEDVIMTKIIHYISLFSSDVQSYLKSQRSKNEMLSEMEKELEMDDCMDLELDNVDPEFVKVLLDSLENFEMFRLCMTVCNRYKLKEQIGRYLISTCFKYSNLRIQNLKEFKNGLYLQKQRQASILANEAIHNMLCLIEPELLSSQSDASKLDLTNEEEKGLDDEPSLEKKKSIEIQKVVRHAGVGEVGLGLDCWRYMFYFGFWNKLIFLTDPFTSLNLSSTIGDIASFKLQYLVTFRDDISDTEASKLLKYKSCLWMFNRGTEEFCVNELVGLTSEQVNEVKLMTMKTAQEEAMVHSNKMLAEVERIISINEANRKYINEKQGNPISKVNFQLPTSFLPANQALNSYILKLLELALQDGFYQQASSRAFDDEFYQAGQELETMFTQLIWDIEVCLQNEKYGRVNPNDFSHKIKMHDCFTVLGRIQSQPYLRKEIKEILYSTHNQNLPFRLYKIIRYMIRQSQAPTQTYLHSFMLPFGIRVPTAHPLFLQGMPYFLMSRDSTFIEKAMFYEDDVRAYQFNRGMESYRDEQKGKHCNIYQYKHELLVHAQKLKQNDLTTYYDYNKVYIADLDANYLHVPAMLCYQCIENQLYGYYKSITFSLKNLSKLLQDNKEINSSLNVLYKEDDEKVHTHSDYHIWRISDFNKGTTTTNLARTQFNQYSESICSRLFIKQFSKSAKPTSIMRRYYTQMNTQYQTYLDQLHGDDLEKYSKTSKKYEAYIHSIKHETHNVLQLQMLSPSHKQNHKLDAEVTVLHKNMDVIMRVLWAKVEGLGIQTVNMMWDYGKMFIRAAEGYNAETDENLPDKLLLKSFGYFSKVGCEQAWLDMVLGSGKLDVGSQSRAVLLKDAWWSQCAGDWHAASDGYLAYIEGSTHINKSFDRLSMFERAFYLAITQDTMGVDTVYLPSKAMLYLDETASFPDHASAFDEMLYFELSTTLLPKPETPSVKFYQNLLTQLLKDYEVMSEYELSFIQPYLICMFDMLITLGVNLEIDMNAAKQLTALWKWVEIIDQTDYLFQDRKDVLLEVMGTKMALTKMRDGFYNTSDEEKQEYLYYDSAVGSSFPFFVGVYGKCDSHTVKTTQIHQQLNHIRTKHAGRVIANYISTHKDEIKSKMTKPVPNETQIETHYLQQHPTLLTSNTLDFSLLMPTLSPTLSSLHNLQQSWYNILFNLIIVKNSFDVQFCITKLQQVDRAYTQLHEGVEAVLQEHRSKQEISHSQFVEVESGKAVELVVEEVKFGLEMMVEGEIGDVVSEMEVELEQWVNQKTEPLLSVDKLMLEAESQVQTYRTKWKKMLDLNKRARISDLTKQLKSLRGRK